jgi:hypothetical protein
MTNLLGPGAYGALRPAATRPPASPANGVSDPDDWFTNCTSPIAADGTVIDALMLNAWIAQKRNLIRRAGVVENNLDDMMIARAVRSNAMNWLTAGGAANAITLTPDPAFAATGHMTGTPLRFIVGATNTAAVTCAVNGLTALNVRKRNGAALQAGDLRAGDLVEMIFNGTEFRIPHTLASDLSFGVRFQRFTASGTFTVPEGIDRVFVETIGGGGGGGASGNASGGGTAGNIGAGGGAGGYGARLVTGLTPGSSVTVTVGAGGTASAAASGGAGGSSSFGAFVSATGGGGGGFGENTLASGGPGGNGASGDLNIQGGDGGFGGTNVAPGSSATQSDMLRIYGRGGVAAGGLSIPSTGGTGASGRGFGTGGAGASGGSGIAGGVGAGGIVTVRW